MSTLGGLHARTWGDPGAPPLLLVHGLTDDGGCWPDAVSRWSARHAVHAVDLPGHGRSPRLTDAEAIDPMRTCALAVGAGLRELADRHGRPAVGIGHSMGAGALALAVADGAPSAALVLEDPRIAHESTRARTRMGRMRAREVSLWQDDPATTVARFRAGLPHWAAAEVDACCAARPLTDPRLLATGRTGIDGADVVQADVVLRAAARTPLLLVTGNASGAIWTPERLALVSDDRVHVAVLDGGGHTVRRDRPEAYHAVVDPFLAAHG